MSRSLSDPWFGLWRRAPRPEARLIAIPYAGAGTAVYRQWLDDLKHEEWLDFAVVQLPGREKRVLEPPVSDFGVLLDGLEQAVLELAAVPLLLFGYSMGASLAYEVSLRLAQRGLTLRHLMVAARVPPYCVTPRATRIVLDRQQIVRKILQLGGTAPDLIESDLFDSHILPTLQADFAAVDNHHRAVPQILPCPVLALGSSDDSDVSVNQMRAWNVAAGGGFELRLLEGEHFFLHTAHERVIAIVNEVLDRYVPQTAGIGAATAGGPG
ncbi:thioesterase II family protein [Bradyrhizobium elkanii]|uniref:thioesterase II family protein n=1 Tax=Bradyrhizobium elkanii TaxID=29448 RepID=UPI001BABEBA6|nr:thioesterase [Bradyrhizobium elkanii]MBR1158097.1 thioesterase [Bradyrhizobium elkanii]